MENWKRLLMANKAWAQERMEARPEFFRELAKEQRPDFLWIGCSDSRVPAEEITGTSPGELFVHRNIANLVVHTDLNLLSVLQFAVENLEVKHIIVCGHYGCGGVRAALTHSRFGLLNKWLRHIKDTWHDHRDELTLIPDGPRRVDRMVELNVMEQVQNLMKTSIIQEAWARHQRPVLHGWVYGLEDGLIKPLVQVPPGSPIDEVYRFEF
jgi:carbonic anhydrase